MDDAHELCTMLSGNYIHVEHRFFGKSRPEGLSNDDTDGWQYLTAENAATDYHRIYTELSKALNGPWTATGTSRGGEVCASYAYYYPKDMGLYMPYVGPFSGSREDPRFYEFVYTKIGDEKYGAETDPIRRLALHAATLVFRNPMSNEIVRLKSPLPEAFDKFVK